MRKENTHSTKPAILQMLLCLAAFIISCNYLMAQTVYPNYQDGRIWFKLKEGTALSAPEPAGQEKFTPEHFAFTGRLKQKYRLRELRKPFVKFNKLSNVSPLHRTYLLSFDDIRNVEKLIKDLEAGGMVEYAEKVPLDKLCFTPNDPGYFNQWNLSKINAQAAWNYFSSGSKVVIAIVDNAVDRTHPDLRPNIWVNPGELPGNNRDDDGNGYIDDVNGWDFGSDDNDPGPDGPAWVHGTHVAGIASAATNNGIGVASIGFSSKLMCVKAANSFQHQFIFNGYEGILYAAQNDADIINLSWGSLGGFSVTNQNIITSVLDMGSIVVAAAGNNNVNSLFYPAAYNGVLSVAATRQDDAKAWFSNYGAWVKVSAPGEGIYSTALNGSYATFDGTSMASPLVAGLASLIRAVNPGLTTQGVINCITNSATNINSINPSYSGLLGTGRINAAAAMACATPCIPPATLGVINIANSFADLTWSAVPGAARFDFEWKLVSEPATSWRRIEVNGASYTLTDLASATAYVFRVRSKCNPDFSAFSNPFTFTTTGIFCGTPTGLSATNTTNNSALLSWNNVPGVLHYFVQYKESASTTWIPVVTTIGTNSYNLTGLTQGTSYDFRVKTICNNGNSIYSAPASFATACTVPPTGLASNNVTNTTAVLSWQAVPGARTYTLQWLAWGGVWKTVTGISNNTYTLRNLQLGTWHTFQVSTVCGNGSSLASNTSLFKTAGSPAMGITVAGGNGAGSATYRLRLPRGICADENGNIYVADSENHRVMKWAPGATAGVVVAGGNGKGSRADQLNVPKGIFRDVFGNLYIADANNNRVQKWAPGATAGVTVAGGNGRGSGARRLDNPRSVFVDESGNVFVSDEGNNRVQKWAPGANTGITVAGGNGAGSAPHRLNRPRGIFVDVNGDLFIADAKNNRIQKWSPGATQGVTVAGGNGSGRTTDRLNNPHDVFVFWGKIYIADENNNRVQRWEFGNTTGETMAGGNGRGRAPNQFDSPRAICIDRQGDLYVVDTENHRVQKFGAVYARTIIANAVDTIPSSLQQRSYSRAQITEENKTVSLTIAPNPVRSPNASVNYSLADDGKATLRIIDLHGRVLQIADLGYRKAGAYLHRMDLNKQVNGYYVVVLEQNNKIIARKQFIISR